MKNENSDFWFKWFAIFFGIISFFAIKSIFESDESKIVSKRGSQLLSDESKMKEVKSKLDSVDDINQYKEILI